MLLFQRYSHDVMMEKRSLVGVYENICNFKHDCRPNCTEYINDLGGISIRAAVNITEGKKNLKDEQKYLELWQFFFCIIVSFCTNTPKTSLI